MKVFKFGGASIRNAHTIRNVAGILKQPQSEKIIVIVSAMGKTTDALEEVLSEFIEEKNSHTAIEKIADYHSSIVKELFPAGHAIGKRIADEFLQIKSALKPSQSRDELYDRVVSLGEVMSSLILSDYLAQEGASVTWADARKLLVTDSNFREANVDWTATETRMQSLNAIHSDIVVTQGFIGADALGRTTTLGRDGSDFSAAVFASCLKAKSVTIWKDVPGVMNADPKRLRDATVFEELPFREAAEMTYYGASVIHPKTIKPLANRNIPLYVKNFDNPALPGTIIHETQITALPPLVVFKDNQCLVSCRVTDYTFIDEEQLSFIFQVLSSLHMKINVMQNSAISFSFCIDFREDKVLNLVERLSSHFDVYYNTDLTLITIKNYNAALSEQYRKKEGILLEQSSRSTLQVLIKN